MAKTFTETSFSKGISDYQLSVLVSKVVTKFVSSKSIPYAEKDDVKQEVMAKFWAKRERIESAFLGKAAKESYYVAVIYRMCQEAIRSNARTWFDVKPTEEAELYNENVDYRLAENRTVIRETIKRLDRVMLGFGDISCKLLICIKVFFNLPIKPDELNAYAHKLSKQLKAEMLTAKERNNQEAFSLLANLVEEVEGKKRTPDAIRMFFNKNIDDLLFRLNKGIQQSTFTRETLGILLDYKYLQDNDN